MCLKRRYMPIADYLLTLRSVIQPLWAKQLIMQPVIGSVRQNIGFFYNEHTHISCSCIGSPSVLGKRHGGCNDSLCPFAAESVRKIPYLIQIACIGLRGFATDEYRRKSACHNNVYLVYRILLYCMNNAVPIKYHAHADVVEAFTIQGSDVDHEFEAHTDS